MSEQRAQIFHEMTTLHEPLDGSFAGVYQINRGAPSSPRWRSSTIECRSCGAPVQPREEACTYCLTTLEVSAPHRAPRVREQRPEWWLDGCSSDGE